LPGSAELGQNVDAGNAAEAGKPASARYLINARASRLTVHVFAKGVLSALGHNPTVAVRGLSGEAWVDPEKVEAASVRITVAASSLGVTDDISDKDRREIERQMFEDVLEVTDYPEIVYACSRVSANKTGEGQYSVELNGELTLHGVTRNQAVSARVMLQGTTLTAFGDFFLHQTDYGIRLVSALGGALKVKDEVKCSFNIAAQKQG
jgi:polyisoprenoid-binding protein YceI